MINFQALNVLLDTLRKPDPRPPPVSRVMAMRPTLRVSAEGTTAANEQRQPALATAARAAPRDFPLLPDPTSGGRLREPAGNARVAAQVLLSTGGAELERALRGSAGRLPAAPTVRAGAPLSATPPPAHISELPDSEDRAVTARSVLALAFALRDAVTQSGLFYESHLARWVADDYPQSELDHEPQAGMPAQPVASADAPATAAASMLAVADAGADPDPAAANAPAPPAASPLLRQQLDVLDTQQFVWVGEAWPGLRTAIRFEQDREHPTAQEPVAEGAPLIRAHVILELPELGTVGAEIAIVQGSVRLQITTDGPAATARLHAARAELAEALAARALPASEIAVFDAL